jgi:hypothetical protein
VGLLQGSHALLKGTGGAVRSCADPMANRGSL